jgi:hypothetical protein
MVPRYCTTVHGAERYKRAQQRYSSVQSPLYCTAPYFANTAFKGRHHMSTAEDETSSGTEGEKIFDAEQYLLPAMKIAIVSVRGRGHSPPDGIKIR